MKRNLVLIVIVALASFAAGSSTVVCLTHMQLSSCSSALDFSDETAEYIEAEVLDGTITMEQVVADADAIHTMNNNVRGNLGLPPWK